MEVLHKSDNPSNLFCLIDQLLEKGTIDEFNDFLNDYRRVYCFDKDDLVDQFDIFRLFDVDSSLDDRIKSFNHINDIEDKFISAGFDEDLVDDLSYRGLSIKNKVILIEIMDYFKGSQLSFNDINDLIRENILVGHMSFDSFNKNKEEYVSIYGNEKSKEISDNIQPHFSNFLKAMIVFHLK